MKIISYNLNGIRAAMTKGWTDWVANQQADFIGIQESKAQPEQVDITALTDMGYHAYWFSAEKKGYSGVAVFTKIVPDLVEAGCGIPKYDMEGRILRTDFGDLTILTCYFPSGTSGDERQEVKMEFLRDFFDWVQVLRQSRPNLVVLGDFNIAHTERDIHNPKGNQNSSGFLPEERAWMTQWLNSGFTDSFRHLNPDIQKYSWWSFRFNSRAQNKGWRIDYICVTDNLRPKLVSAELLNDAEHSDHCPCVLELATGF